jgi:hypothetical protein
MQVGGERLGRVGIAVAGQERRDMARFGVARRRLAGMEGSVMVGDDVKWHGNAGMEKPVEATGMEGSGTVGIMEARQAWSGCSGRDCSGLTGSGWLRHGRRGATR